MIEKGVTFCQNLFCKHCIAKTDFIRILLFFPFPRLKRKTHITGSIAFLLLFFFFSAKCSAQPKLLPDSNHYKYEYDKELICSILPSFLLVTPINKSLLGYNLSVELYKKNNRFLQTGGGISNYYTRNNMDSANFLTSSLMTYYFGNMIGLTAKRFFLIGHYLAYSNSNYIYKNGYAIGNSFSSLFSLTLNFDKLNLKKSKEYGRSSFQFRTYYFFRYLDSFTNSNPTNKFIIDTKYHFNFQILYAYRF